MAVCCIPEILIWWQHMTLWTWLLEVGTVKNLQHSSHLQKKINKTFLEDGKHSFWQVYEIAWTFSYQWTMAILNTRPVGIEEA